jgi:glutamate synthase domain-containing protein 1
MRNNVSTSSLQKKSGVTVQYGLPAQQGLYDPRQERDACGVGFVAHIKGTPSHSIVSQGLQILENLTHRGAVGADPLAGDGAGILIQIPDKFLRDELGWGGIKLPAAGEYGVGMIFLPRDDAARAACEKVIAKKIDAEGQTLIGWRDVPVDRSGLGESVKAVEPVVRQVFIGRGKKIKDQDSFERKLFVIRKTAEHAVRDLVDEQGSGFYVPSMSSRTVVYKGMLLAGSGRQIFYRLARPARCQRFGAGASTLFHQHFPDLESGTSVPHDRAQRRDQHGARQRKLDGGAPCGDVVKISGRRFGKTVAADC